jgi:preprotein translocase subunit SecG
MLVLALAPWATNLLILGFLGICLLMVLTVLIQKPQGGGLASAFGGGGSGSGQTAFGTKTGDALTFFTIIVFALYVIFAVVLNYASNPKADAPAVPAAGAAPAVPAPSTTPAPTPAAPVVTPPPATGTPAPESAVPTSPSSNPAPSSPAPTEPTTPAPSTPPTTTPTTPPAPTTSPGGGQ